jgi:hypothetical protein
MAASNSSAPASGIAATLVAAYDGVDRIALLPKAKLVLVAPGQDTETPVQVTIQWSPASWERPIPGSSLWRAVLTDQLSRLSDTDPADGILRTQIEQCLARFPNLEHWWAWVRSGWLTPPVPEQRPIHKDERSRC